MTPKPDPTADLAFLLDQGSKLAVIFTSRHPLLVALGNATAPLLQDEWKARFPDSYAASQAATAALKQSVKSQMQVKGPLIWAVWHPRALAFAGDAVAEAKYINELVKEIPCPACRNDFRVFMRSNPPVLTSALDYFAWTVRSHNYVSAKINKENPMLPPRKIWSVEEALAKYQAPRP